MSDWTPGTPSRPPPWTHWWPLSDLGLGWREPDCVEWLAGWLAGCWHGASVWWDHSALPNTRPYSAILTSASPPQHSGHPARHCMEETRPHITKSDKQTLQMNKRKRDIQIVSLCHHDWYWSGLNCSGWVQAVHTWSGSVWITATALDGSQAWGFFLLLAKSPFGRSQSQAEKRNQNMCLFLWHNTPKQPRLLLLLKYSFELALWHTTRRKANIFGTKHLQKALQVNREKIRAYKINPSVEHQCYVYYLDQFSYIFL